MASASSAPATPVSALASQTVVSSAPTGTWQHPKFDEINRRLAASTFGEKNVRTIVANVAFFLLTFLLPSPSKVHPAIGGLFDSLAPLPTFTLLAARLIPFLFILFACLPLLKPKDDLSDIPLTPSQRALLGLGPASRPATPGSQFVTPPKYSRSTTPRSSAHSASPLGSSGRGSPFGTTGYSPSPLFQKAVNRDTSRRLSYGNPSPLGQSKLLAGDSVLSNSGIGSPSPTSRSNFGLSSRWVYDKMRDTPSPKRRSMYS